MITALTAGRSKAHVSAIRASKEWGKRPTAVIMQDDWFGHRSPITGHPMGDKDEWIDWDHILVNVYQVIQDYTNSDGILAWVHDAEYIEVDAEKKINKFQDSVQRRTASHGKKQYKPTPGEYFVPDVHSRKKDPVTKEEIFPTYREWVESLAENG